MCDLKATAQLNTQSLIWVFMLYEFEMGHNAMKVTKIIYCAKGEGTVDCSMVTRWFKKFHPGNKNLDDQERSGRFVYCSSP